MRSQKTTDRNIKEPVMAAQHNTSIGSRLVKVKAAADYLAISERKLWDLSQNGTISVVRLGRSIRYDLIDLDSFIEKMKKGIK